MSQQPLMQTDIPGIPVRHGKVRDVYDFGDKLLLVATDRISAFDWVLPTGIPDKGRVLTMLSEFWFKKLDVAHHLITTDVTTLNLPAGVDVDSLAGRSMIVHKTEVVPIECVIRGYLAGSGWKEYKKRGTACDIKLPKGLREGDQLPEAIFTPATKEETGHDENIPFSKMEEIVGGSLASRLRSIANSIYRQGANYARSRGIIIADTKFEFGTTLPTNGIMLIDEVLTPDSSRFWPADQHRPGEEQVSFDKQYTRDWLTEESGWDMKGPPPELPDDVVARTREKYIEAYERLTEQSFPWK